MFLCFGFFSASIYSFFILCVCLIDLLNQWSVCLSLYHFVFLPLYYCLAFCMFVSLSLLSGCLSVSVLWTVCPCFCLLFMVQKSARADDIDMQNIAKSNQNSATGPKKSIKFVFLFTLQPL